MLRLSDPGAALDRGIQVSHTRHLLILDYIYSIIIVDRAEEWNLASPLFAGCLRVFHAEQRIRIVLYRYVNAASRSMSDDNLAVFAQCPFGKP